MRELWYQKHRPQTLDGYVFVDEKIEKKVNEWVEEKEFPHLLLSGSPGCGKCLDGSEAIDVEIDLSSLSDEQIEALKKYEQDTTERYRLPIRELFSILGIDDIKYEEPVSVEAKVKISSPTGYVDIRKFVKKHHMAAEYVLENGDSVQCSTKHIVFSDGEPVHISNTSKLDTVSGSETIVGVNELGVRDVYDVALDAPHQYVTPNGIIHHNTTLATILVSECGYEDVDAKFISASVTNGIDTIRDEIMTFAEKQSFGPKGRVVVIDEADYTSAQFQAALRNIITDYADSCRFILTCNYPHKIIPAIKSRCFHVQFSNLQKDQYLLRLAEILTKEKVRVDNETIEILQKYADKYYPDMRQAINALENNTSKGVLSEESNAASNESPDWMLESIVYFEQGDIRKAREHIIKHITYEDYEDFYAAMYKNLDWFGDTLDKQDAALLAIKDAYVDDTTVANREIVLSACLTKLNRIRSKS